jgi:hypothetical protein
MGLEGAHPETTYTARRMMERAQIAESCSCGMLPSKAGEPAVAADRATALG